MAELYENPASVLFKGLIDGSITTLGTTEQRTIASWLIKSDTLYELVRPCPPDQSRRLRSREVIRQRLVRMMWNDAMPPFVTARIGLFSAEPARRRSPFLPSDIARSPEILFSSVNAVVRVASETVFWNSDPTRFVAETRRDTRFEFVWPPQEGPIRWPPMRKLDLEDSYRLRDEWGHARDNYVGGLWEGVAALLVPRTPGLDPQDIIVVPTPENSD